MPVDLARRPRTRMHFSDADMIRLRDLYYDRDVPMIKVAGAFGLSASTLYHWIAEMDWPRRSAQFPIRTHPAAPAPDEAPPPAVADTATDGPPGPKLREEGFAVALADAARRELRALGDLSGPIDPGLSLHERKRRADIIASLSRSIARLDRTLEARVKEATLRNELRRLRKARIARPADAAADAAVANLQVQVARALERHMQRTDPDARPRTPPRARAR